MKKIMISLALLFAAQFAAATPILLTFTSNVTSAAANPYGVSVGDSSVLVVTVDNGGSGYLSQSWDVGDILSAEWTSGIYSAFWDATTSWFSSASPQFTTDALGIVTAANFQGSSSSNGVDNGGVSAYLWQDGVRTSEGANLLTDDYYNSRATRWVASSARVPEPGTLALVGLGLLGFGFRRKIKG